MSNSDERIIYHLTEMLEKNQMVTDIIYTVGLISLIGLIAFFAYVAFLYARMFYYSVHFHVINYKAIKVGNRKVRWWNLPRSLISTSLDMPIGKPKGYNLRISGSNYFWELNFDDAGKSKITWSVWKSQLGSRVESLPTTDNSTNEEMK